MTNKAGEGKCTMSFTACVERSGLLLMEGALGERLKRDYRLDFDPHVAMASLALRQQGAEALQTLWRQYMAIAGAHGLPFLATTPTRRANRERVTQGGFDSGIIARNMALLREVQRQSPVEMYAGGLMGCKGDAYTGQGALSRQEARDFHLWQAALFAQAGADFLYAGIMPTLPEAAGMAQAMAGTGLPYIISLTIRRDGRLIDGTSIHDAILYIDSVASPRPVCYMTNCVHPAILYEALCQPINRSRTVTERFLGIQANTSPLSYEELDGAEELHCSPPGDFAREMARLREISKIKIFGGCCGTDHRHMERLAQALTR